MTTTENAAPVLATIDLYRILGDLLEGLDVEIVGFRTEYHAMSAGIDLAGASAESLPVAYSMLDDAQVETSPVAEAVVAVSVVGTYRGVGTRVTRGCINDEADLTRTAAGPELLAALAQAHANQSADDSREG